jgi:hypothetical protein
MPHFFPNWFVEVAGDGSNVSPVPGITRPAFRVFGFGTSTCLARVTLPLRGNVVLVSVIVLLQHLLTGLLQHGKAFGRLSEVIFESAEERFYIVIMIYPANSGQY